MNLLDENRYRNRRVANKIRSSLLSLILRIVVLVVAVFVVIRCLPWLKTLWETIS